MKTLARSSRHLLLACVVVSLPVLATAQSRGSESASAPGSGSPDWVVSPDGAYVYDLRAGLAWPRCVEGMQWTGKTCTGKPLLLDRAEATALAANRWKAEGTGWRLPRAAELQRLVDKTANPPGLNTRFFPAAPDLWYWSSTANVSGLRATNPYNYNTIRQDRQGDSAGQMALLNGWAVACPPAK
ncbi:MAG: DUF1566 domain-containing protein [Gammaproteobacteria bacterium]|nr:DUF1566 domain-containing protein [Gammaproteobacteria bacterium]MBU1506219.1 DUF1566 domain-containing protein [Gammaproteobacteria bacterium]MBU2122914.1 DUF1566 domain-containing protein [Gammaproteobacteria bacterium]MBU2169384.1 DUF1566 domain-containing protein [Gammaproteobacteria bacterium]MBU2201536.1 DUF1566 domain-containing protein [Gammaproteobacteria bacterium]